MGKHNLSPTPGLHRVEPKTQWGLATKVTGRNLAAVSYIISLEAEQRGVELALVAVFGEDGSLKQGVVVEAGVPQTDFLPGDYLVLDPDNPNGEAEFLEEEDYLAEYRLVDA